MNSSSERCSLYSQPTSSTVHRRCTTCLIMQDELLPIEDDISLEFSYLANIEVNRQEFICKKCIIQLVSACQFKRQCLFSHRKISSNTDLSDTEDKLSRENESVQNSNQNIETHTEVKKNPLQPVKPLLPKKPMASNKDGAKPKNIARASSTEQISFIKKGRIPLVNKNYAKFYSNQQFPTPENRKGKGTRSKSADNMLNYYGKVCREVFSKMDDFKKYKKRHFSQLTNLFINDAGPTASGKTINRNRSPKYNPDTSGVCSSCGKLFKELNKHIAICPCIKRKKSGRKQCDRCGKLLTDLTKHKCQVESSSTIANPCSCDKCGKRFNSYKSLWSHKKYFHNDNKIKLDCQFCPKSYSNASARREHVMTKHESRPMPHVCTYCNKGFPSTTKLKRHLATHKNELAFECFICLSSYTKKSDLAAHMKSQHNNIFQPPNELTKSLPIKI